MATYKFFELNYIMDMKFKIADLHEMYTRCFLLKKQRKFGAFHELSNLRESLHGQDFGQGLRLVVRRGCVMHKRVLPLKVVTSSSSGVYDESFFPSFLPSEVQHIQEQAARDMAVRIDRLPVQTDLSRAPIMTSCVVPNIKGSTYLPVLLLHGFDSSCLEWRHTYPLLEGSGIQCWAVDILGWGFSTSAEPILSFDVKSKREHLYEFWKTYIGEPVVLVGASLGGTTAMDFSLNHPDAVNNLVLIDAQGYAEGLGKMATLPRVLAYAGVAILKSFCVRAYASYLMNSSTSWTNLVDIVRIGSLHCLMPGWADATVDFMLSGGYNIASSICEVQQDVLVVWGEEDKIFPKNFAEKFMNDLPRAQLELISNCGHAPHLEKPKVVASLIRNFVKRKQTMQ